ncbi:fibulin-7-like isoform X1 [Anomalospiza imberbis]|uniref:fibulin-7-like isoform X1 n=1 Tax=Anomalospiza imberbis TaxID=187417 RepID=UPI00358E2B1E
MLLIPLPAWLALGILQLPLGSSQECLNRQQALSVVQQMQKLLVAQEAAHLQGTRGLRHQLSILQSHLQRPATKHNGNPGWSPPWVTSHGASSDPWLHTNSLRKGPPAPCQAGVGSRLAVPIPTHVCLSTEMCPQLAVPLNGRMLGRSLRVGHEVHFICDAGFRLVGSETRACRHNRTWSGTQPFCRSIDDCSSNPCANSGTCVDGNQSYTCLCPPGWSGPSCQSPIYSYWVTLSNTSFSRQPRCAEGRSGSRRCSCDTGFQLQPGGVCQDVDECQLYQSSPQTQICLHDCLNLPGSYRCLCPPGYLLHADRNACEDVNECAGKQHNCSQGDLCINTFGGHRCVRPKCPPPRHNTSYVKTSAFQCERNPCPMDSRACHLAASSISFHYLPLQANRTVPRVLFKMSTTRFVGDSLRFAITGGRGQGVFAVRRSDRQTGELLLTSPVAGPATLEVELEMSEFSHKVLLGKHIFKVTAFVSPYVF